MLPFANFNRIHVVPPCNVSEQEARDGLAILDTALDVARRGPRGAASPIRR